MRGGGGRQAKLHPRLFHHQCNGARVQRLAACPDKQRGLACQIIGAGGAIGRNRPLGCRDHRHHAFLAAFAPDPQGRGQWCVAGLQPQRLGYPQAATIQQRHHRRIAHVDPFGLALHLDRINHRLCRIDRQRAWQFALDHVLEAVEQSREIGLETTINILIGHPEETWADLRKSVRFMLKASWLGCSDTAVMMFCPYPGSADFEALVSSGRHEIDEASYYVGLSRGSSQHRSWNPRMSAGQMRFMQLFMISSFYIVNWIRRPKRAFAFFKSQITGSENTYLDQMVRTKRKNLDHKVDKAEGKRRIKAKTDETANARRESESAPALTSSRGRCR